MKKCPFCKAEIEDTARFCLYCMTPLNEKEVILPPKRKTPWWPFALAAALLITLVAVLLLLPGEHENLPAASTGEGSSSTGQTTETVVETTDESTQDTQNEDDQSQGDPSSEENPTGDETPGTNQDPPKNPDPDPQTPQGVTPPVDEDTPTEGASQETPEETPEPDGSESDVEYTYRAAREGDDFNANYANSGSDIVITGVKTQAADGVYDIPSYIDGKKVIAIVANAFSDSNAKTVYIPATVKTIWNYAFAGCDLAHIYFRGSAIYVESNAFAGALTIHCSASCSDRNFRYYKDSAANYGATWKEWNG